MFDMKLPPAVMKAVNLLEENGYKAHLVGGCVRDRAMGITPHDYDIATNAVPDDMKRIFHGFNLIETGIKHGTLTVIIDSEPIEITTYRIDGEYEDNRHPKSVSFTDSLYLDLSRRDFTVNAMAYSPSSGLIDEFSGAEHIKSKKIVCVGDPYKRFGEDGLRVLRALRFASVLSFDLEENTARAVFEKSHLLESVSKERIFTEIKKTLCGRGCGKIFKDFSAIIAQCIPYISEKTPVRCADIIAETKDDPCTRLALVYLVDQGEQNKAYQIKDSMKIMKASRQEINRTVRLFENCSASLPTEIPQIKRLAGRLDKEDVLAAASIRRALGDSNTEDFLSGYKAVTNSHACVRISELDIDGNEIKSSFGLSGAQIGEALNYLLELVIDEKAENSRDALKAEIRKKFNL